MGGRIELVKRLFYVPIYFKYILVFWIEQPKLHINK